MANIWNRAIRTEQIGENYCSAKRYLSWTNFKIWSYDLQRRLFCHSTFFKGYSHGIEWTSKMLLFMLLGPGEQYKGTDPPLAINFRFRLCASCTAQPVVDTTKHHTMRPFNRLLHTDIHSYKRFDICCSFNWLHFHWQTSSTWWLFGKHKSFYLSNVDPVLWVLSNFSCFNPMEMPVSDSSRQVLMCV